NGLGGSSYFAVARRRNNRHSSSARRVVWTAVSGSRLQGQVTRRSAGDCTAGAASNGPGVLPACHVWCPLADRSGLPGSRRLSVAVLVSGSVARLGDRQHSVRGSTRSTRLRGDSN